MITFLKDGGAAEWGTLGWDKMEGFPKAVSEVMLLNFWSQIRSCDRLEVGETRKSGHFSIIAEDLEKALGIIPVHNYFH